MHKRIVVLAFFVLSWPAFAQPPAFDLFAGHPQPSVLVLHDGPDREGNPGRLDALYLANLLGHFTTRRTVHSLETYQAGELQKYDAVFTLVYEKRYTVPPVFLRDVAQGTKTFCWLGNQVGQL